MSSLRILALSYLASASVFVMAATLAAHPRMIDSMTTGSQDVAERLAERVWNPLVEAVRRQRAAFLDARDAAALPDSHVRITMTAPPEPRKIAAAVPRQVVAAPIDQPEFAASAEMTILPDLSPELDDNWRNRPLAPLSAPPEPKLARPRMPQVSMPDIQVASPDDDHVAMARLSPPPAFATPPTARAMEAAARLKVSLTPEMVRAFDLFLYVSKADHGPLAQRMYVFRKETGNVLRLAYDWPASTGREKQEVNPRGNSTLTDTPRGYYEFDPSRMYRRYHSYSWDQAMPYAMFFNWEREGLQTGLAIHSASGDDIARLGQRASAGCVHLSPENAQTLYTMIRAEYRGEVPRFAYNTRTQTMSNDGTFMHDADGHLKMRDGYKVLTFIEDYGGGNTVAALF